MNHSHNIATFLVARVTFVMVVVILFFGSSYAAYGQGVLTQVDQDSLLRAHSSWQAIDIIDKWGEVAGKGVASATVSPVRPADSPYDDLMGRIYLQCGDQIVILQLTESPNLTGGETRDGYETHQLFVKLDDAETTWRASQRWGSDAVILSPDGGLYNFYRAKEFQILLPWYGNYYVHFRWDLVGIREVTEETCTTKSVEQTVDLTPRCQSLRHNMDNALSAYETQKNDANRQRMREATSIYHTECG